MSEYIKHLDIISEWKEKIVSYEEKVPVLCLQKTEEAYTHSLF